MHGNNKHQILGSSFPWKQKAKEIKEWYMEVSKVKKYLKQTWKRVLGFDRAGCGHKLYNFFLLFCLLGIFHNKK